MHKLRFLSVGYAISTALKPLSVSAGCWVVQVRDIDSWALWLAGALGVAALVAGIALYAVSRAERGR
ncbi:MAG: hypothetical protein LM564_02390 [Desulfurococcaceae archaeon]|nr:hypothetical protein [Desulfurococcaceae archaeon]